MLLIQAWHIVYGKNSTLAITIISSITIVILTIIFIKKFNNIENMLKIAFTMVIGGGISNLIDRIFRGHVIDYIDINKIFKYPIFNIADIFIVIGIFTIILFILKNCNTKQENI